MSWTQDELDHIDEAEELEIASLRADGTLRKFVTIWMVCVEDALYVRSVKGRDGWWFRGVLDQHAGRISAGGVTKDVTFVEVPASDPVNDVIDEAYKTKYARYPQYWAPMVVPLSQASTLRLDVREG